MQGVGKRETSILLYHLGKNNSQENLDKILVDMLAEHVG